MARRNETLTSVESAIPEVADGTLYEEDALTKIAVVERQEKQTVDQLARTALARGETRRRALLKQYRAEEKVPVYLSPMYRPYLGNVMLVSINGISIAFRVDGTVQEVPKTFADEIVTRRINIDNLLMKQQRMSDVQANLERSPGELQLF